MILVGTQRGGAKNLALHLLKPDNDHVEVHELRGFASDNLHSALNESYAISRGTQCRQFLYSLSINPPPDRHISTEEFENAINRAESTLGLGGQPRAIVFHEKSGADGIPRRHAHAVWSRIDTEQMKAIQLSHDHRKLTALSRELYIEHGYKMPRGLMASEERDTRNFSLEEWQQAKRAGKDRQAIKDAIQDCWAVSDSRPAFMQALESRGCKLARGDRRGYVAVDRQGEPYAIARWTGAKTKDVRTRLGELEKDFPSVEDRKQEFAEEISQRLAELHRDEQHKEAEERQRREAERHVLVERQRIERMEQTDALKVRQERETAERQQRFNRGLRGLIDRITGRHGRTREQNLRETEEALRRDRAERDATVARQLQERRTLDKQRRDALAQMQDCQRELRNDMQQYRTLPADQSRVVPSRPEVNAQEPARAPPQPAAGPAVVQPGPIPAQANDEQTARDARREEFIRQRQEQATPQPARDRGPGMSR
ncbi:hypothetical protein SAMN05518801_1114 [Novosphingobium sp. CF614]|uniref:relaxase/mobilization nuclease domain-containing protein n=1 Tax=Novosphingobium sp. CF614 TaxID=1884364 RepID=UPI0008E203A5|nr:hypothetical protein [Novosphingobium sp. CF614]SFG22020.1 hypothetical protein SAMN05518801_1114 [Novosphingobium sp. CF614]